MSSIPLHSSKPRHRITNSRHAILVPSIITTESYPLPSPCDHQRRLKRTPRHANMIGDRPDPHRIGSNRRKEQRNEESATSPSRKERNLGRVSEYQRRRRGTKRAVPSTVRILGFHRTVEQGAEPLNKHTQGQPEDQLVAAT